MNVIATDIIFSAANKRKLDKNDIMEKYRKKKRPFEILFITVLLKSE